MHAAVPRGHFLASLEAAARPYLAQHVRPFAMRLATFVQCSGSVAEWDAAVDTAVAGLRIDGSPDGGCAGSCAGTAVPASEHEDKAGWAFAEAGGHRGSPGVWVSAREDSSVAAGWAGCPAIDSVVPGAALRAGQGEGEGGLEHDALAALARPQAGSHRWLDGAGSRFAGRKRLLALQMKGGALSPSARDGPAGTVCNKKMNVVSCLGTKGGEGASKRRDVVVSNEDELRAPVDALSTSQEISSDRETADGTGADSVQSL
jgi:hypothetical protein